MDESALRSALASTNDCGSSLHWWLGFWTVWVVVGVGLELIVVGWEYVDELHDFRRGVVHPPDRPNRLLFALGFFATALVTLDVGGELYAESKIETVETCIRKGNDALFLLLSKEAGDAQRSAARAEASEKALEIKASALTLRLEAASGQLTEVEHDTLALSPRWRLLERGKDVFIKALKPFPGQRVDITSCGSLDVDRFRLGQLFLDIFPKAGWNPVENRTWLQCPTTLTWR
jgi:hypothetical protein